MFKRIAQPLGLLLLSWSSALHALGLGEIEVQSQLNQPLRATIALPSATAAELETLVVRVAPNSAFDRAGIELAAYVSSLQFEVVREGTPSVRVTSTELAREPFLSFLIEARWAGGRILREYTVLLDPPNLAAASAPAEPVAQPAPAPQTAKPAAPVAKPAAPVISQPAEPVFYEEDPAAVPPATRRYSTEREPAQPAVAPAPTVTAASAPAASTYGPVKRQETLWSIAVKLRPDPKSVTMDQMLIALFESNQEAFGGDINGLRTGSMLTVPPLLDIVAVDPVEAKRRVDAARQRGAAAPAPAAAKPRSVTPTAPKRPAPPPLEREREPEPEPEPEPAPKPVAPATAPRASAPDANSALAQLQAMAGQNSGQPAGTQSAAPEPEAEPEPEPELAEPFEDESLAEAPEEIEEELGPEPEPEVEVVEPVAVAPVVEEPASGGLPWMGIGLGLLILILGGAGWVFYKRRGQDKEQAVPAAAAAAAASASASTAETDDSDEADEPSFDEVAAATAVDIEDEAEDTAAFEATADDDQLMDETQSLPDDLDAEPAEVASDEVDFDVTAQFQADTMQINLDANDPVSEADFHLAYGLYDEAALLLQQAQEREPGRQDIKIKLAETYFAGGKTEEFLDAARNLKGELPEAEWQKIVIMGSQIAGDDPLFLDAGEAAAEGVDLDFGGDEAAAAPAEASGEADVADVADAATATDDDNSLAFDLDLDAEPTPEPKAEAPAADSADDNSLEFDLGDFDLEMDEADEPKAEAPASAQPEPAKSESASDTGIESLDLDSFDMGPSNELSDEALTTGARNEPSLDIGDFGLDELDASTESEEPPAADSATDRKEPTLDEDQAAELDFADLGLDDDSAEPGISDGDEASTKLDLARAYIDMGDNEMAKGLLDEVVTQGNDEQKAAAEELIQRLPSA